MQVLLEQPGVAAVEELEIKRRWGKTRSVTARISFHGGADARDVCRSAAQALAKQLRVADVCLVTAAALGETASREGTL
jgi:Flp pilus assembly CpaE family ATPase